MYISSVSLCASVCLVVVACQAFPRAVGNYTIVSAAFTYSLARNELRHPRERRRSCVPGYVTGIGAGSTSPKYRLIGGTVGSIAGPAKPMTTDQKRAGRSRDAQRKYLRGVAQKCGAADML